MDFTPLAVVIVPIVILLSISERKDFNEPLFEMPLKIILAFFCLFYLLVFSISKYLAWLAFAMVMALSLIFIIRYVVWVFQGIGILKAGEDDE